MLVYQINDPVIFPNASEIYVSEDVPISDGDPVVAIIGDSVVCRHAHKIPEGYRLTHPKHGDLFVSEVVGRVVQYSIPV